MSKCSHEKFETIPNVGFDIWESGEECQHLDVCKDCGASRLNCDRIIWSGLALEPIRTKVLDDWDLTGDQLYHLGY